MRARSKWTGWPGLAGLLALSSHCGGAPNYFEGAKEGSADAGKKSDSGSSDSGGTSGSSSGSASSSSGGSSGGSSGSSSGSGSGSSSGSTSGSTSGSSSGSSSGGTSDCADPNTNALCTGCITAGQPCQANGCYGGYDCNTTTDKCQAPGNCQ